jgi:hypothetical protein
MGPLDVSDFSIARYVDELFADAQHGQLSWNPVTGACYVHGIDPIGPQKDRARRALFAREWFAIHGPPDAQPFPVCYAQRERLKHGGVDHILAWYARSVEGVDYAIWEHPPFYEYGCGVMASEFCPRFIEKDEDLQKRFPPRPLRLNNAVIWVPSRKKRKRH